MFSSMQQKMNKLKGKDEKNMEWDNAVISSCWSQCSWRSCVTLMIDGDWVFELNVCMVWMLDREFWLIFGVKKILTNTLVLVKPDRY